MDKPRSLRRGRQAWQNAGSLLVLRFMPAGDLAASGEGAPQEYGRAMARANFLQPARASLVDEWAGFIRDDFPEKARDVDIAAFADGHVKGYSVTAEVFADMNLAKRLAYDAWDGIFTLGQTPVEYMKTVCSQIQEAQ